MDKDCSEIQEQLSGYLDHILSDEEEFEVEVHLAHCESCREELHALMKIHDTLAELKTVKAPEDFLAQVQAKITSAGEQEDTVETTTIEEKGDLNSMQAVVFPKEEIERDDKPALSEPANEESLLADIHETPLEEERIEPDVMTPEQMTEQTHIDIKANKFANIIDDLLALFRKRTYQAGLGLALASICMMILVRNSGMDKPVQMTASPDLVGQSFESSEPVKAKRATSLQKDAVPSSMAMLSVADGDLAKARAMELVEAETDYQPQYKKYAPDRANAAFSSRDIASDVVENELVMHDYSGADSAIVSFNAKGAQALAFDSQAKEVSGQALYSADLGNNNFQGLTFTDNENLGVTAAKVEGIKSKSIVEASVNNVVEQVQERSFSSVLDKLSSSTKSYEARSYDTYRSESSYGFTDTAHSFNRSVTESLSDIERQVLESAVSRADDELRDEYGYKNYFSDESLEGITVDDAEIEDPMSISIANDRNMVYINSDDPAYIVNMLRDMSDELALEEPIVNASELPYVVSFYVTGTVIERLLDECRAAGIRDMFMSFQLEASDYDETSLYYLQIDR